MGQLRSCESSASAVWFNDAADARTTGRAGWYGDDSGGVASEAALLRLFEPSPSSVHYVIERLHACAARHAAARAHGGFGAGYRWRPKNYAQWARKRRLSWCERTKISRARPDGTEELAEAHDDPWLTIGWVEQLAAALPPTLRPASRVIDALAAVFGSDASAMLAKLPELARRLLAACDYDAMNLIDAIKCGINFAPLFVAPPSMWSMDLSKAWPIASASIDATVDAAAALWRRIGGVEGSVLPARRVLRELQRAWVSSAALSRVTVPGGEVDIEAQIAEDLLSSAEESEEDELGDALFAAAPTAGGSREVESTSCATCLRTLLDQLGGSGTFGIHSSAALTFRDVAKLALAPRLLALRRKALDAAWGGADSSVLATATQDIAHDASLVDISLGSLSLFIRVRGRRGDGSGGVAGGSRSAGRHPGLLQIDLSEDDLAHLRLNAPGMRHGRPGAVVTHLSPELNVVLRDLVERLRIRPIDPLTRNADGSPVGTDAAGRTCELLLAAGRGSRLDALHRVCSTFMLAQSAMTAESPRKARGAARTPAVAARAEATVTKSAAFFVVATEVELIFKLGVCRLDAVDGASPGTLTRAAALHCVLRHLFRPRFGATIHELMELTLSIRVAVEVASPPARFTLPWHDFRSLLHSAIPVAVGLRMSEQSAWSRTEVAPCVLAMDGEKELRVSPFDAGCEWLDWADGNAALPWWWRRARASHVSAGSRRLDIRICRAAFAPADGRPHRIVRWIEEWLRTHQPPDPGSTAAGSPTAGSPAAGSGGGAASAGGHLSIATAAALDFDRLAAAVRAAQINFGQNRAALAALNLRNDVMREEIVAFLERLAHEAAGAPTVARLATALHERPNMVLRWCGEFRERGAAASLQRGAAEASAPGLLVGSVSLDEVLRLPRGGTLEVQVPLRTSEEGQHSGWLRVALRTVDVTTSALPLRPLPVIAPKTAKPGIELDASKQAALSTSFSAHSPAKSKKAPVAALPKEDATANAPLTRAPAPATARDEHDEPAAKQRPGRSVSPLASLGAAQKLRRKSSKRGLSMAAQPGAAEAKKASSPMSPMSRSPSSVRARMQQAAKAKTRASRAVRSISPVLSSGGSASQAGVRALPPHEAAVGVDAPTPSTPGSQAAMLGAVQRMLEQVRRSVCVRAACRSGIRIRRSPSSHPRVPRLFLRRLSLTQNVLLEQSQQLLIGLLVVSAGQALIEPIHNIVQQRGELTEIGFLALHLLARVAVNLT